MNPSLTNFSRGLGGYTHGSFRVESDNAKQADALYNLKHDPKVTDLNGRTGSQAVSGLGR